MPQLNLDTREITLKIVYYGPALSGKTTNIQQVHAMVAAGAAGEMVTLDTQGDRTLYFDFLPIEIAGDGDYRIKLKLFTVPGQVMHRATRRVVLAGVDGVTFVADSQRESASANAYSYRDLEANLRANGIEMASMPSVVQFNKRDLDDIKSLDEIREAWQGTGVPTIPAVAVKGEGVIETFQALMERLYRSLDERHDFGRKFGLTADAFMQVVASQFGEKKDEV
jgi:signal recognition particle receptor subunit beta